MAAGRPDRVRRRADARALDHRPAGAALTTLPPGARSARELALLRLVAQGLAGPRPPTPQAAAERLLALQAQDYWSGLASVAVRCGIALEQVQAAFDAGQIVRAWPLRGTLHLLAAADLGWMRELLAPRQLASAALREAREGFDAPWLERADRVAVELLNQRGPQSRAQLNEAWTAAGLDVAGQRSYHLIWHLAHSGTLVLGPTREGQQLFAPAHSWLPPAPSLDRAEALRRLARRYFDGHGPATAADLTRWANLTVTDTRAAIAAARPELAALTVGVEEYLLGIDTQDALAADRRRANEVLALPHFDELLLGYRHRDPTLPVQRDLGVFANRNGVPARTIVYRGQVVATWRRATKGPSGAVEVTPLTTVPEAVLGRAARAAGKLSARSA